MKNIFLEHDIFIIEEPFIIINLIIPIYTKNTMYVIILN